MLVHGRAGVAGWAVSHRIALTERHGLGFVPGGVTVARLTLDQVVGVQIPAGQLASQPVDCEYVLANPKRATAGTANRHSGHSFFVR